MLKNKFNKRSAKLTDQYLKNIVKTEEDINKLKDNPCSMNQKT